jgi:hypothetical protein
VQHERRRPQRHGEQIAHHLAHPIAVRDRVTDPGERLKAVLGAFADISHRSRGNFGSCLVAALHRDEQVAGAHAQVQDLIRDLVAEAAEAGEVRDDVEPGELAAFCVHALTAAGNLSSEDAVRRLVAVTLAWLRPADWVLQVETCLYAARKPPKIRRRFRQGLSPVRDGDLRASALATSCPAYPLSGRRCSKQPSTRRTP